MTGRPRTPVRMPGVLDLTYQLIHPPPPHSSRATLDVLQDLSKWNLPELLSWNADHVAGVAQSGSGNGSPGGVGGEVRLKGLSLARSAAEAEGNAPHTSHSPYTLSVSGTHVLACAARLRALRPLRLLR
jgi:hypothetical protein